jgi:hypothetical protein
LGSFQSLGKLYKQQQALEMPEVEAVNSHILLDVQAVPKVTCCPVSPRTVPVLVSQVLYLGEQLGWCLYYNKMPKIINS